MGPPRRARFLATANRRVRSVFTERGDRGVFGRRTTTRATRAASRLKSPRDSRLRGILRIALLDRAYLALARLYRSNASPRGVFRPTIRPRSYRPAAHPSASHPSAPLLLRPSCPPRCPPASRPRPRSPPRCASRSDTPSRSGAIDRASGARRVAPPRERSAPSFESRTEPPLPVDICFGVDRSTDRSIEPTPSIITPLTPPRIVPSSPALPTQAPVSTVVKASAKDAAAKSAAVAAGGGGRRRGAHGGRPRGGVRARRRPVRRPHPVQEERRVQEAREAGDQGAREAPEEVRGGLRPRARRSRRRRTRRARGSRRTAKPVSCAARTASRTSSSTATSSTSASSRSRASVSSTSRAGSATPAARTSCSTRSSRRSRRRARSSSTCRWRWA